MSFSPSGDDLCRAGAGAGARPARRALGGVTICPPSFGHQTVAAPSSVEGRHHMMIDARRLTVQRHRRRLRRSATPGTGASGGAMPTPSMAYSRAATPGTPTPSMACSPDEMQDDDDSMATAAQEAQDDSPMADVRR